ncbi:MAG: tetratricopeptide repeat protein [Planctomycetes bacterium]|jgi:tetratricopeptide (TPR) repeat protein|nr:tetratricopeptide repeat protein [Planctomycetota bacterium]
MKTRFAPRSLRSRLAGLSLACVSLAASVAAAQSSAPAAASDVDAIWNDPAFKKAFIAGYGFNAEIEPRVTPDEVEVLDAVRPLMATDLAKAETALKKRMKPDGSAILDFTLGGIQFQQGKLDDALASHKVAVDKFPSFRRAWRNLGLINAQAGKFDDAIRAFTRMIELGGGDGYSYGLLGSAYASKNDFQAAEGAYRNALLLQPERVEWRLGLTRAVLAQEKFEDAANLANSLIALYPDNHGFWLLQARTFLGMKQPLRAAENLEIVGQLGKATGETLNLLADIYASEGLMERAAFTYVRSIATDPAQAVTKPLQAVEFLTQRGALAEADHVARKVREAYLPRLQEDEKRRLLKLEARIAMGQGDSSEAVVQVLEEIVTLDPLDGDALLLLGQNFAQKGEPDRAILYYERAAGVPAFEASAKMRQAQTYMGMGRYADAVPLLRRVQELKPREDVARLLEQVERLAKARR